MGLWPTWGPWSVKCGWAVLESRSRVALARAVTCLRQRDCESIRKARLSRPILSARRRLKQLRDARGGRRWGRRRLHGCLRSDRSPLRQRCTNTSIYRLRAILTSLISDLLDRSPFFFFGVPLWFIAAAVFSCQQARVGLSVTYFSLQESSLFLAWRSRRGAISPGWARLARGCMRYVHVDDMHVVYCWLLLLRSA